MYGGEDIVLKSVKFKNLKFTIFFMCLIAFAVGTSFFLVSKAIAESYIKSYVANNDICQKEQEQKAVELEDYIKKNNVNLSDTNKIAKWVDNQSYLYLKIMKEDKLLYDSVSGKSFKDISDIDSNEDVLINSYGINSIYTIEIDNELADVLIYCFTEFRMISFAKTILLIISFAIFFTFLTILVGKKVKYLSVLKREIKTLTEKDLYQKITIKGSDEICDIAQGIDSLRCSVIKKFENEQMLYQKNQALITSLSHDLRTPLTSIIAYLEILQSDCAEEEENRYKISALKQAYRLKDIADSLFNYSASESENTVVKEMVNGNELVMQMVEEPAIEMETNGVKIQRNTSEINCKLFVCVPMIHRIFENIFSNIKKYADKNHPLTISYGTRNNNLFVSFKNVKSKEPSTDTNGFGLKNIHELIYYHSGNVVIDNDTNTFIITTYFPIYS